MIFVKTKSVPMSQSDILEYSGFVTSDMTSRCTHVSDMSSVGKFSISVSRPLIVQSLQILSPYWFNVESPIYKSCFPEYMEEKYKRRTILIFNFLSNLVVCYLQLIHILRWNWFRRIYMTFGEWLNHRVWRMEANSQSHLLDPTMFYLPNQI